MKTTGMTWGHVFMSPSTWPSFDTYPCLTWNTRWTHQQRQWQVTGVHEHNERVYKRVSIQGMFTFYLFSLYLLTIPHFRIMRRVTGVPSLSSCTLHLTSHHHLARMVRQRGLISAALHPLTKHKTEMSALSPPPSLIFAPTLGVFGTLLQTLRMETHPTWVWLCVQCPFIYTKHKNHPCWMHFCVRCPSAHQAWKPTHIGCLSDLRLNFVLILKHFCK